ncbi:MAG: alpha/beta fold hydrolase [Gaiellaceae bacterium]
MKILLLHALPLDERMWQPQRDALAGHEVATPRLYRRGSSMDGWADSLLDENGGELLLVGASMGGYCALSMARRAPDRVRAVLLAGSRAEADSAERRAGRAETIELIRQDGAEGLWAMMRPKLFGPQAPGAAVDRARELALEQDPEDLEAAVEAIRDRSDQSQTAHDLGERLLLTLGDGDPFVAVDEVPPSIPTHVFPDTGHLPSLERPEEFDRVLRAFVARWT